MYPGSYLRGNEGRRYLCDLAAFCIVTLTFLFNKSEIGNVIHLFRILSKNKTFTQGCLPCLKPQ